MVKIFHDIECFCRNVTKMAENGWKKAENDQNRPFLDPNLPKKHVLTPKTTQNHVFDPKMTLNDFDPF